MILLQRRNLLAACLLLPLCATDGYLLSSAQYPARATGSTSISRRVGLTIALEKKKDVDEKPAVVRSVEDFFSRKEKPPAPPEKKDWFGVFRRKEKPAPEKRSKTEVFKDAFRKATFQSKQDDNKKDVDQSVVKRIQGLRFSKPRSANERNRKSDEKKSKKSDKKKSDKKMEKNTNDSSNALSMAQTFEKFAGGLVKEKETWVTVFSKTRIMPGEMVPVTAAGLDLLVIAAKDGRLYCLANSCPHLGTPLETGKMTRLPIEVDKKMSNQEENGTGSGTGSGTATIPFSETDVTDMLSQDGCEDCIVCPLHRTAFALKTGQVRGEWCPYPPVLGAVAGAITPRTNAAVFDVRTRGRNVQVRLNTVLTDATGDGIGGSDSKRGSKDR